jgi:sulfur carrier protein ThiS
MNNAAITLILLGPFHEKVLSDQTVPISENETILTVVTRLSIGHHPWYLYSVNGQHAKAGTPLHNGDVLMIISPMSGG